MCPGFDVGVGAAVAPVSGRHPARQWLSGWASLGLGGADGLLTLIRSFLPSPPYQSRSQDPRKCDIRFGLDIAGERVVDPSYSVVISRPARSAPYAHSLLRLFWEFRFPQVESRRVVEQTRKYEVERWEDGHETRLVRSNRLHQSLERVILRPFPEPPATCRPLPKPLPPLPLPPANMRDSRHYNCSPKSLLRDQK